MSRARRDRRAAPSASPESRQGVASHRSVASPARRVRVAGTSVPARALRIATLGFAALALCHLAAGVHADPRIWGVHELAFLPWMARAAAAVVLALLVLPGPAAAVGHAAAAVGSRLLGRTAALTLVALAAGAIFYAARLRAFFLGDGRLWIEKLQSNTMLHNFEPLAATLVRVVAHRADPAHPERWGGLTSVVLGIVYVLATAWLCRTLWRGAATRGLAWLLLLAHPVLLLFFGYVESYPLLLVLQVLFAWSLVWATSGGRARLVPPTLLLGLAIASHLQAVLWSPALAALLWVREVGASDRTAKVASGPRPVEGIGAPKVAMRRGAMQLAAMQLAALLLAALFIRVAGGSVSELWTALRGDSALGAVRLQWFASARHAIDFGNECLLLLAAPLLLLPAASVSVSLRGLLRGRWLCIASLLPGPLLFLLVVPPQIGAARDWDLFASLALPALLLAVEAWRRSWDAHAETDTAEPSPGAALIAGRALGLAAVTSLAWLAVNVDAPRAARRLVVLQQPSGTFSNFARGYANETLGVFYRDIDLPAASAAYTRAIEANARNPRYYNNLGNIEAKLGHTAVALDAYRHALDLGMNDWFVIYNVGLGELQTGRAEEAERHFDRLVREWPDRWLGLAYRGQARLECGRPREALQDLDIALSRWPQQPDLYYVRGRILQALGREREARAAWERTLQLDPNFPLARKALSLLDAPPSVPPAP